MKQTDKELDQLIDQLATSTRSPRGEYTAEKSYTILHAKLFGKSRKLQLLRTIASAAAIVLLCIAGWGVYTTLQPESIITESTQGAIKTIILPDGSEVTLNNFSTLRYPKKFEEGNRLVSLTGEAYFDVARDEKKPFIVETGHINIEVLGTQFNVEAYANDPEMKTTLLEGSVAVYNNQTERIVLKPNESAIYNKVEKTLTHTADEEAIDEIAWKQGNFIFKNIALEDITRKLSNSFGVKITINLENEYLKELRLTGRFVENESLTDILDLLKDVAKFEYKTTEQGNILIYKN